MDGCRERKGQDGKEWGDRRRERQTREMERQTREMERDGGRFPETPWSV